MHFPSFFFVPLIIFLTIVAPIWIVMHYRSINRSSQSLNEDDRRTVDSMLATIDKLQDRIRALESLLDMNQSDWRSHQGQSHSKAGEE
jgi:phage shock protein B